MNASITQVSSASICNKPYTWIANARIQGKTRHRLGANVYKTHSDEGLVLEYYT